MIGQIKGRLIGKNAPEILVEVGGITYEILVPMSTLYQLPDLDGMVHLHTHFSVREDAQILYGFFDAESKRMFRSLVRVNGVGPKLALGILSGMSVDEFVQTVKSNDSDSLVKMPGVGKKTAERLIIEMRDKLSEWDSTDASSNLIAFPDLKLKFLIFEYLFLFNTISSTFFSILLLNFKPLESKNFNPLYSYVLWEAVIITPISALKVFISNGTAGVGNGPTKITSIPIEIKPPVTKGS